MVEYQFTDCDRRNFFGTHVELQLGPWRTRYLSFAYPNTQHLPPVVFIGGAFQNAWSFRAEVAGLLDLRPILIVELPGQGSNTQVCAEFGFTELATLLAQVLDHLGLDQVLPIGLSYGAAIVHRFGVLFPERARKLVLVGIAPRLPRSAHLFSRAFAWLLHNGQKQAFATSLTQHLFNVAALHHTGVTPALMQRLADSILKFDANQTERFDANLRRLHVEQLEGQPRQPTFVLAGRHDSFVHPHEAMAVANACEAGQLALATDCDHLAPLERPERLVAIYRALLQDKPIDSVPSMLTGEVATRALAERRLSPRCWGQQAKLVLTSPDGQRFDAELVDVSSHGCRVRRAIQFDADDNPAPWRVQFADTDVATDALPYGNAADFGAGDDSRLLFLNTDFDATAALKAHIDSSFRCSLEQCPQSFATEANGWGGTHRTATISDPPCVRRPLAYEKPGRTNVTF